VTTTSLAEGERCPRCHAPAVITANRTRLPTQGANQMSRFITLHCGEPGCDRTVNPDPRHLGNLTAAGSGWWCHEHDEPELQEVTC
jgi:hypothetical protein